jgi:hypothetical protein
MTKKLALIIVVLLMSISLASSAFSGICDPLIFTITTDYLETTNQSIPVTFYAEITNPNLTTYSMVNVTSGWTPPVDLGILTLLSIPKVLKPDISWTGPFAEFQFNTGLTAVQIQQIQFWVEAESFPAGCPLQKTYDIGTAALVPEPSSILLLMTSLLGLVGFKLIRRRA